MDSSSEWPLVCCFFSPNLCMHRSSPHPVYFVLFKMVTQTLFGRRKYYEILQYAIFSSLQIGMLFKDAGII